MTPKQIVLAIALGLVISFALITLNAPQPVAPHQAEIAPVPTPPAVASAPASTPVVLYDWGFGDLYVVQGMMFITITVMMVALTAVLLMFAPRRQ